MSNLVYFICTGIGEDSIAGDMHVDMCHLCMHSLRTMGGYDGEIMVITDREDEFSGMENVDYTVGLSSDWVKSLDDIGFLRFGARQWIDTRRYDSIMFLDNDILAINDVNPILDLPENNIVISEEYGINNMFFSYGKFENIPFLEDDEKEEALNRPRINTGIFCMDSEVFLDYTERIEQFVRHCSKNYRYKGVEQHPINAMVLRGEVKYQPIPHGWVEFPIAAMNGGSGAVITDATKLIHYVGGIESSEKITHMRTVFDLAMDRELDKIRRIYSR